MTCALILFGEADPVRLHALQQGIAQMRDELAQRELAIGDLRSSLLSFEGRYIRQVGILYKQLDEWNSRRAALHAAQTSEHAGEGEIEEAAVGNGLSPAKSIDVRRIFRQLTKRIHPDYASDALDADRRTRLMAQANEALRRLDQRTLERMLHGHESSMDAREPRRGRSARLERELATLRADLAAADAEWSLLRSSELAKLREGVLQAAREGRDLLAEMAVRVQGLIGIAMRQYELDLDRIRRPNRGLAVESLLSAETPPVPTLRYDAKQRRWIR